MQPPYMLVEQETKMTDTLFTLLALAATTGIGIAGAMLGVAWLQRLR